MKWLAFLFITHLAAAATMNCDVTEVFGGSNTTTQIVVPLTEDPHGNLQVFQLQHFSDYSGMLAIVKNYAVIHLYNTSGFAFTTHADLSGSGYAYSQLYMPNGDAIQISCQVEK